MREIGPSYGWYLVPVVVGVLVVVGMVVSVFGGAWHDIARPGLQWLVLAGAGVLIVAVAGSLFGPRRRSRHLLGTSVAVGVAALAIAVVRPTTLSHEYGLLWYKQDIGENIAQEIVKSAPRAAGEQVELSTALNEYFLAQASGVDTERTMVVEGFLFQDKTADEMNYYAGPTESAEGQFGTTRTYNPSKGFKLGRFCAFETLGDAALLSVDVSYDKNQPLDAFPGEWVRVTGVVGPTILGERTIPIFWASDAKKMKRAPAQLYLWGGGK